MPYVRGLDQVVNHAMAEVDRVWERLGHVPMGGRSETDPESSKALETLLR